MINQIGKNILITTSGWFFAPDGRQYRAVWGKLKAVQEAGKSLGFIPNRAHANWFIEIGDMTIMGCQVMYLIECEAKPCTDRVPEYHSDAANGLKEFRRPTNIYISNEP